jgi:hypothetical protein
MEATDISPQGRYLEWPCGSRRSGPSGQLCGLSKPRCSAPYRDQQRDQVLPHDLAAGPLVRHADRGHHFSAWSIPLHADRAREGAVSLEGATHPQLLMVVELGDRKPSQFLRPQELCRDLLKDFLRRNWSSRLPPTPASTRPTWTPQPAMRTASPRSHHSQR